jgi:hypothetical protein
MLLAHMIVSTTTNPAFGIYDGEPEHFVFLCPTTPGAELERVSEEFLKTLCVALITTRPLEGAVPEEILREPGLYPTGCFPTRQLSHPQVYFPKLTVRIWERIFSFIGKSDTAAVLLQFPDFVAPDRNSSKHRSATDSTTVCCGKDGEASSFWE